MRLVTRSASHFLRSDARDFAHIFFCLRNAWILCSLIERRGNSVPAKNASKVSKKRNQRIKGTGSDRGTCSSMGKGSKGGED